MILLWGVLRDRPLAAVRSALVDLGPRIALLDQRDVPRARIELSVTNIVEGRIEVAGETLDLASVTAGYFRPYDSRRLPEVSRAGRGSAVWDHVLDFDDTLWCWAELTRARMVNRGAAMASNGSKPYQMAQIRRLQFRVPETLITTDPAAVDEFRQRHQTVVYKSTSSVRSIVTRLTARDLDRLDRVSMCPTQFQEYVPGTDHRVHVVGEEVFCCKVLSAADDYRYANEQGASVELRPVSLPDEIAERCRALTRTLGLHVAGLDLRLTPEGSWYCFEINPSPGFTYFDPAGEPIARAIARLLAAAT